MARPKEVTKTIQVPGNTGINGFLRTMEEILKLQNVQRITVESSGEVTYKRYVTDGENAQNFNLDLANLQPHHIIRNCGDVQEFLYANGTNAATIVGAMLDAVTNQKLTPIAFATGAASELFNWYRRSTGVELKDKKSLFGYQLYKDRALPDTSLVLCAGQGYTQALVDTRLAFKAEIPVVRVMDDEMEVT